MTSLKSLAMVAGLVSALSEVPLPPRRREVRITNIDDVTIGPAGIEWKPGRAPSLPKKTKRHAGKEKKAARKRQQAGRRANRK